MAAQIHALRASCRRFWLAGALAQSRWAAIRSPLRSTVPLPPALHPQPTSRFACCRPARSPSPILRPTSRTREARARFHLIHLASALLLLLSSFLPASQHQHTALPFFHPLQPLSPSSVRGVVVLAVGAVVAAARPRRLIERKRTQTAPVAFSRKIHQKFTPKGVPEARTKTF